MGEKSKRVYLGFKVAQGKVEALDALIKEGKFADRTDAIETALTLLLYHYGKLGIPQPSQRTGKGVV